MKEAFRLAEVLSDKSGKQEVITYNALLRMIAGFCDLQEQIARRTINEQFETYKRENLSQNP